MRARNPKVLVVDTDVIGRASAAADPLPPGALSCLAALESILELCHRVAVTRPLADEWDRHESGYLRGWLTRMVQKGKAPEVLPLADDPRLRNAVATGAGSDDDRDEILRDLHLVEAAFQAHMTVISCDAKARTRFARAAHRYGKLGRVVWVNPDRMTVAEVTGWLKDDARPREDLRLKPRGTSPRARQ